VGGISLPVSIALVIVLPGHSMDLSLDVRGTLPRYLLVTPRQNI
jgi:hypothetical protein